MGKPGGTRVGKSSKAPCLPHGKWLEEKRPIEKLPDRAKGCPGFLKSKDPDRKRDYGR